MQKSSSEVAQKPTDPTNPKLDKEQRKGKSPFQLAYRRFVKNRMAVVGLILLTIIVLISVFAPLLTSHDPLESDMYNIEAPPSDEHILGTDDMGRDVYARLLYGGRISLLIGLLTMIFTVLIGAVLGAIAGYYGKWIDTLIMRFTDIMLTFPFLLFVLFLISVLEETSVTVLIVALALTSWPTTARIVRGVFLSLREQEFVLSARAIGGSDSRLIFRHMIPNALAPIIVNATLLMAVTISAESALSFLGFGVPQPTPTWGNMLTNAMNIRVLSDQPWLWIPPGVMIVLAVLAINFIGDGLRDAFDTKMSDNK